MCSSRMRINRRHKNNLTRVDSLTERERKGVRERERGTILKALLLPLPQAPGPRIKYFKYFCCFLFGAAALVPLCGTSFAQGTNKLDLPNRISGINVGSAGAAAAAEARHKRAMGEYKELNDIIDDLDENGLVQKGGAAATASQAQAQEFDLDSMPPLAYYMLLERLRQCEYRAHAAYE